MSRVLRQINGTQDALDIGHRETVYDFGQRVDDSTVGEPILPKCKKRPGLLSGALDVAAGSPSVHRLAENLHARVMSNAECTRLASSGAHRPRCSAFQWP